MLNFGCEWWSNFHNIFKIKNDSDLKIAIQKISSNKFNFNKKLLYQDIFDTYNKTIEFNNYSEHSHMKYYKIKSDNLVDDKKIQNHFNKHLS